MDNALPTLIPALRQATWLALPSETSTVTIHVMSRPTWVRSILCVLRTVLPTCQSDKKKVQALDGAINLAEEEPEHPEPGPSHHVEESWSLVKNTHRGRLHEGEVMFCVRSWYLEGIIFWGEGVNISFYWRIISLQCCGGLCHASIQISHNYIYIPSLLSLPPHWEFYYGCWSYLK